MCESGFILKGNEPKVILSPAPAAHGAPDA
jgi:hypothetical protein